MRSRTTLRRLGRREFLGAAAGVGATAAGLALWANDARLPGRGARGATAHRLAGPRLRGNGCRQ